MATSRLLTINIRNYLVDKPRRKRHMKVVGYVRERVAHYTKTPESNVKITKELNSTIMKQYVKSMHPIKLTVNIDNGKATVTQFMEKGAAKPAPATTPTTAKTKAAPAAKAESKPDAKTATKMPSNKSVAKPAAEKQPKAEKPKE